MTRLMLANPSKDAANATNRYLNIETPFPLTTVLISIRDPGFDSPRPCRYAGNREKGLSVAPLAPSVASSVIGNSIPTRPIGKKG